MKNFGMCDPNDSAAPCACWQLACTRAFREALVSGARSKILPKKYDIYGVVFVINTW